MWPPTQSAHDFLENCNFVTFAVAGPAILLWLAMTTTAVKSICVADSEAANINFFSLPTDTFCGLSNCNERAATRVRLGNVKYFDRYFTTTIELVAAVYALSAVYFTHLILKDHLLRRAHKTLSTELLKRDV